MSRLFPAAGRRFAPWKNGGGETAEILCHPAGAGFENFDWRISTARVATSGPFSVFPGVDRSLTVIGGGAMRLRLGDGREVFLDPSSGPFAFSGDIGCEAELVGPPLLDFNVMVRRPLAARVTAARDHRPPDLPCLARYLFALEPFPGAGRHDLLDISGDATVPPYAGALVVEILRS